MSNLEYLVPPLDLCRKISPGAFEDSVLVWFGVKNHDSTMEVVPRAELGVTCHMFLQKGLGILYPAPTLAEILLELILFGEPCCFWQGGFYVRDDYGNDEYDMVNASTAGLKLWLEVNKTYRANKTDKTDKEE